MSLINEEVRVHHKVLYEGAQAVKQEGELPGSAQTLGTHFCSSSSPCSAPHHSWDPKKQWRHV